MRRVDYIKIVRSEWFFVVVMMAGVALVTSAV